MSAVSQDAIAVPQGDAGRVRDRSQVAADEAAARLAHAALLLAADVIGLLVAYLVALAARAPRRSGGSRRAGWEVALFVATLPLWVLLARVYGLYDRDEERTDHSTVDDVVGVFQVVTLGTWSFLVVTHVARTAVPESRTARRVLAHLPSSSCRCFVP